MTSSRHCINNQTRTQAFLVNSFAACDAEQVGHELTLAVLAGLAAALAPDRDVLCRTEMVGVRCPASARALLHLHDFLSCATAMICHENARRGVP